MALTPEEKKKLEELKQELVEAADRLGNAIKEGSASFAKATFRGIKEWAADVEKSFDRPEKK